MWIKVLIADKDSHSRALAAGILLELGCEVELSGDEKETAEKAEEFKPEVIFMDVQTAITGAGEIISRLRQKDKWNPLQIAALAQPGLSKIEVKNLEEIYDAVLIKPVSASGYKEFIENFRAKNNGYVNKFRILCVDDEPLNLELLEAILIPAGYDVIKAKDGSAALVLLKNKEIDLVLLDVMMPGLNGYDVCRLIKASPETSGVPVVMITALSGREDRIKSIEAGSEDFITKPFEKAEVLTRIRKLLEISEKNSKIVSLFGVLSGLADRGNRSAELLKNSRFNFFTEVDELMTGIASANGRGPRGILIGTNEIGWLHYDMNSGFSKKPGKSFPGNNLSFLLEGNTRMFYSGEYEHPQDEAVKVSGVLSKAGINAGNFICRAGAGLCAAAYGYKKNVNEQDAVILKAITMQIMFLRSVSQQIKETEQAYDYLVLTLARAAEANDEDTGMHIVRVGEYAAMLSARLGLDKTFTEKIRMQAQMHDVGKIHIKSEILRKPGPLTPEEFEVMKLHTVFGAKIIGSQDWLSMGRRIAASHHEKWDGRGYPEGLAGKEIPLEARITTIADQYDALRNARVYKPAFDHQKTVDIIVKGDGRTNPGDFDPSVLRVFTEYAADFEAIYEKLKC